MAEMTEICQVSPNRLQPENSAVDCRTASVLYLRLVTLTLWLFGFRVVYTEGIKHLRLGCLVAITHMILSN